MSRFKETKTASELNRGDTYSVPKHMVPSQCRKLDDDYFTDTVDGVVVGPDYTVVFGYNYVVELPHSQYVYIS